MCVSYVWLFSMIVCYKMKINDILYIYSVEFNASLQLVGFQAQ